MNHVHILFIYSLVYPALAVPFLTSMLLEKGSLQKTLLNLTA